MGTNTTSDEVDLLRIEVAALNELLEVQQKVVSEQSAKLEQVNVELREESKLREKTITELKEAERELAKISLYTRSLIEASLDPLVTINPNGKIMDVNKATVAVTGVSREELFGQDFSDYFTEPEKAREVYQQVFSQGIVRDYPLAIRHVSGRVTDVIYNASIYTNEAGEVQGVFAAARDITQRKLSEEAVAAERHRLFSVLETMPAYVGLLTPDYQVAFANRYFKERFGEPGGRRCYEYMFGRSDPCENCQAYKVLETKKPEEYELLGPDGRTYQICDQLMHDTDGSLLLLEMGIDITERKRAEEALRRSEGRKAILNRISMVFLTLPDEEMFAEVLDIVLEVTESKFGIFGFIADNGDLVIPSMTREIWGECLVPDKSIVFPKDTWGYSLWGKAIRERQAYCSDGPFQTTEGHIQIDNFLTAPIIFGKKTIGLLSVANRATGYTDEDKELFESITNFISPILNARLERNRQEQERQRAEAALEKRLIALSKPQDDPEGIYFHDLFNIEDIQRLQDLFAKATGVASIITNPDGTPITKHSNFCRLCIEIIRQTEVGLKNCYYSDAILGRHHPEGPVIQPCLSGGLWDAGASITVGGRHIANWLIGQVRNEAQSEEKMREYARQIGVNEDEFIKAFYEVITMPESQFKQVADALFALANQLSTVAYQNMQQARFITERKQAEEALQKSELQYRLLAENVIDVIWTMDLNWKFTYASPSSESLSGYKDREIVGMTLDQLLTSDSMDLCKKTMADLLSPENLGRQEYPHFILPQLELRFKDGSRSVYIEIKGSFLKDSQGQPRGMVGVTRDITERKQLEEQFLQAQKMEAVGTLAGGIAHDFNNILTAILGNIGLAALDNIGTRSKNRLAQAEAACWRAQALSQQLLTFAKGGAPVKELFSVAELLTESTAFTCVGSPVRCKTTFPENLWWIEADPGQIGQVFQNLTINAIQAMPTGGTIEVWAENLTLGKDSDLPLSAGRYIKISVRDQGIGIPAEHLPRIFDPYFTTKQQGSGLGLASAYAIIRKHHGYIAVESKPGVGTTFYIYLPAVDQQATPQPEDRELLVGEGKILAMDDEEIVREVLGRMLARLGYEAVFARGGGEAIEMFVQAQESGQAFAAVILDLTVPGGIGGKETMARLLEIDPRAKVVVSSGYSDDPVMAEFGKYGFSGVIAKPYRISELSRVLNKIISKVI